MERGVRKGIDTLVDVTRIPGLDEISLDEDGIIHLGPLVTHNHAVASKLIRDHAYPLARACWEVGSPQLRNRATIAGNLITASPANDTITPLMALGARVTLQSLRGGQVVSRQIALSDFYLGVRKTEMQPDEMLIDIAFPAMKANQRGHFVKFALRRAQAISLVNAAMVLTLEDSQVREAQITLGSVSPTIIHAVEAEQFLLGKTLDDDIIRQAGELAAQASSPISDLRGSAGYRLRMVKVCTQRGLKAIAAGKERVEMPVNPVLLWGTSQHPPVSLPQPLHHSEADAIITRINGKEYTLPGGQHKNLLRLLREDALLIGSKEGCAEGECGSCTVFLDGVAVLSCMVPAARAHGADIITVEGLADNGKLHPVQEAFVEYGAVQCGYCTPGFLMSAAKLLEERKQPSDNEIRQAISGNLCRCTGYYKIIEAIESAAAKGK
jgi:xanthine dehydrogenase iron-sulfur cluster and FAD-binding subunit A